MKKIVETGTIDNKGRLLLPIDRVRQFCRGKQGRLVLVTIEAYERKTSDALRGYYYNYVLPTYVQGRKEQGEYLTLDDADRALVGEYPEKKDEMRASDFGQDTMLDFLEWLKMTSAERGIYIEDPRTL